MNYIHNPIKIIKDNSEAWTLESNLVDAKVLKAINDASIKTQIDFEYLMAVSYQESGLNPNIKAPTSSATGLFQFINSTWLGMIKNYGAEYGLKKHSDKIEFKNKQYLVSDKSTKDEILDLKKNAELNALMGALFQSDNKKALEKALNRTCNPTDLYLAHFLGVAGAKRFLKANDNDLGVDVVDSGVASANAYVFYKNPKSFEDPKTVKEIYDFYKKKIEDKMKLFQQQ